MKKPKYPKKPTFPKIKKPEKTIVEYYYPYDVYTDFTTSKKELKFIKDTDIPDDGEDQVTCEDWLDTHSARESLSLQKLIDYATHHKIPPSQIKVGAIIPHQDADHTELELRITRKRTSDELAQEEKAYRKEMESYEARLAEYKKAKVEWPHRKAEYELWKAQQKLNSLPKNNK